MDLRPNVNLVDVRCVSLKTVTNLPKALKRNCIYNIDILLQKKGFKIIWKSGSFRNREKL